MKSIQWLDEVYKRKDQLIHQCINLCSIPSIYDPSSASSAAPFGKEIARALHYMIDVAKKDGFTVKDVDGYAAHIEMGTGEELIGILTHVDVVPTGEGWITPPFEPTIRDGKLYARGAIDDKGPTIAVYMAMKLIKQLGIPLSKRVRLVIGTDEERDWQCLKHYFSKEEMPTMGFSPDAEFPMITSEKGLLSFKLKQTLAPAKDHSDQWKLITFTSGERVNMVPDYAVVRLEGEGDVFGLKEQYQSYLLEHRMHGFAEESDTGVELHLQGIAHHAVNPASGLNAGLAMARFLKELTLDTQGEQYITFLNLWFVDSFHGEKLHLSSKEEHSITVNVGVIRYQAGQKHQTDVNLRFPIEVNTSTILQQIKQAIAPYDMSLDITEQVPVHTVSDDHPLVVILGTVYEQQTGQSAKPLSTGGATYARFLKAGVAFGPVFPDEQEMTAHQRNEYIEVERLLKATAIYAQAIAELAK